MSSHEVLYGSKPSIMKFLKTFGTTAYVAVVPNEKLAGQKVQKMYIGHVKLKKL